MTDRPDTDDTHDNGAIARPPADAPPAHRARWAAAAGIGSGALIAALMYARSGRTKPKKDTK